MLPYEPIAFMHTHTIGAECTPIHTQRFQYTVTDILLPSYLSSRYMYTLFHTPPIYNWLRTIHSPESSMLNQYIREKPLKCGPLKCEPLKCSHDGLLGFLRKYVEKWEIVKLCWSGRAYVKDCLCSHVCKKQLNCWEYTYHPTTKSFRCGKVFCKQCGVNHQAKIDVVKLPSFLALDTYYGEHIEGGYEVVMAFMNGEVYIRAANTMWYQVGEQLKIIQINNIPFKKAVSVIYAQPLPSLPLLKKAIPFEIIEMQPNVTIQPSKHDRLIQKKEKKEKEKDELKKKKLELKPQELNELRLVSNQLILPPSLKREGQYRQGVMGLFVEEKVKDAYQLQYDRGKQRKVRQKKTYLKPDFNKVFKQLKEQSKEVWKEKKQEEWDEYDFKKKKN